MHSYISGGPQAATLLPPIPTRTIVGAGLANRRLDKCQRACLAADVLDGIVMFSPSQKQLADLLGVSVPYINAARRLLPGKRAAILKGWDPTSFTDLMNPPKQMSLAMPKVPAITVIDATEISDSYLATVIRAAGVDRVLEAAIAAERT
jgi:hypothetical protein